MLIFNLGIYYLTNGKNFGGNLSPHVGILLISGLLFGPYGAAGSVIGNIICDSIRGYNPLSTFFSAIVSFAVSYLGYKLWYENLNHRSEITVPKLNNTSNVLLFLLIINFCGLIYVLLHGKLFYLIYPNTIPINFTIEARYFLNFINSSFVIGIIGIWVSNKIDFIHTPKPSKKEFNEKTYKIIGILLMASILITIIIDSTSALNNVIVTGELIIVTAILFIYLTKPQAYEVSKNNGKSIPGEIMNIFLLTTLIILFLGFLATYDHILLTAVNEYIPLNKSEIVMTMMILMDILLLIYLIPSMFVLRYVERNVINPIISFSKIEEFVNENEKIKSDGLVNIYSEYINNETEIGSLARSYTDLINHNNHYIENIHEIEGKKKRIETELDIATKIQASNLPTKPLETNEYKVNGFSKPAKEVGGDFFDYYPLDKDNLVIVIGDASGKGIPAAILAMITQVTIKQILKHEKDPSKVLYLLNNHLCENNSESMFITLWLGIYNKNTSKIIFSNAGHNRPLIKDKNGFDYLNIDTGIVLGVMEDFDFVKEEMVFSKELIVYTDGITDANNTNNEMYGENRLKKFFNEFESENDPIKPLLENIDEFTNGEDQFDDMTLLYLKEKP